MKDSLTVTLQIAAASITMEKLLWCSLFEFIHTNNLMHQMSRNNSIVWKFPNGEDFVVFHFERDYSDSRKER